MLGSWARPRALQAFIILQLSTHATSFTLAFIIVTLPERLLHCQAATCLVDRMRQPLRLFAFDPPDNTNDWVKCLYLVPMISFDF